MACWKRGLAQGGIKSQWLRGIALAGALAVGETRAQVTTAIWLSDLAAGPGNWSATSLWNLLLPASGYNVVINNGLIFPALVNLDVDASIGQFTIGPGAILNISNGRRLTFTSNSSLAGTLSLSAVSTNTELIVDGLLTVSGAGSIAMSAATQNRIRGASASDTLTNQVTIQGAGAVGDNALVIVNQGVIMANSSVPLVVDPSAGGLTNTGVLRAANSATLRLNNGTFANTGGLIEAQTGSVVQFNSADVVGGSLTSSGTGSLDVVGPTSLQDAALTAGSVLNVINGADVTLLNTFANNGTFNLLASGADTDLKVTGNVTLSGTGTVNLSDSDRNRIYASGTAALVLGPNQLLQGAGKLGRNNLAISNQGTIVTLGTNVLEIDNDGSSFTNQGTLKATGSGGIRIIDGTVTNQGAIEVTSLLTMNGTFAQTGSSSSTTLLGGTLSANSLSFVAGTLVGAGTITGATSLTGATSVIPGGSGTAGTLAFNQTFTLGSAGTTYFDLGGTAPGTGYDRITGTTVNVAGNVSVAFTNSFQYSITPTDTFTLISATTALNGTFAGLPDGTRFNTADGLGSFQINYSASALTLSNFQAIPEPSTWVLLTVGSAICGLRLVRGSRRRTP